ncbi:MAG: DUF3108 domain-containing protein [Paludibacteraceae bacterium]|nr:DUF3108 domain-containing protein [Paludibacteraceae bacterium]
MKKIILTISATAAMAMAAGAQTMPLKMNNTTFKAGERITFDAYFNLGLIWVHAAKVTFTVQNTTFQKKEAYKLTAAGSTLNTFAKFYTVHDTLYSYAERSTLIPLYYKRIAHEDSYWAEDIFVFNKNTETETSVKTTCLRRKKEPNTKQLELKGVVTDLVTAIYRLRNFDFEHSQPVKYVPFNLVYDDDGKKFDLNVKYVGKEVVTLKNGDKYRCIKLKPKMIKGGIFKSEDAVTIWMTDDKNRIPVYIEAKIKVGALKAYLRSHQGLSHELTSYVGKEK